MLSVLGDHRFDVTHRAVVIHRLDAVTPAAELRQRAASTPADALLLAAAPGGDDHVLASSTTAIREATDRPVIVRASDGDVVTACLAAGAAGVHLGAQGADTRNLAMVAEAGAMAIVAGDEAARAEPADRAGALLAMAAGARESGVQPERVAVDVTRGPAGLPFAAAASLEELALVAGAGCPAMVELASTDPSGEDDDEAPLVAAATLLVARGARLLVTDRPRPVRRVAFVLAELLAARRPAEAKR